MQPGRDRDFHGQTDAGRISGEDENILEMRGLNRQMFSFFNTGIHSSFRQMDTSNSVIFKASVPWCLESERSSSWETQESAWIVAYLVHFTMPVAKAMRTSHSVTAAINVRAIFFISHRFP